MLFEATDKHNQLIIWQLLIINIGGTLHANYQGREIIWVRLDIEGFGRESPKKDGTIKRDSNRGNRVCPRDIIQQK